MKTLYFNIIFFVSILYCHFAFANDSTATTAAGGIQFTKTDKIKMISENLQVSTEKIKVDYVFKNISDKDITTTIVFPLPPFVDADVMGMQVVWDDEVANNKDTPLGTFKIKVNGKSIQHKTSISAMLNGQDIAPILKKEGIPLNTILASNNCIGECDVDDQGHVEGMFPDTQFQAWVRKAKKMGLVDSEGKPLWEKQIMYYWTQTFPAHQSVFISHEYVPTNGHNDIREWKMQDCKTDLFDLYATNHPISKNLPKEVCLNDDGKNLFFTNWPEYYALAGQDYPFSEHVKYILTTGANWNGPIEHFTLNIQYPKTNAAVMYNTFYEHSAFKLTKTSGNITLHLDNFTPHEDLSILFFNKR